MCSFYLHTAGTPLSPSSTQSVLVPVLTVVFGVFFFFMLFLVITLVLLWFMKAGENPPEQKHDADEKGVVKNEHSDAGTGEGGTNEDYSKL